MPKSSIKVVSVTHQPYKLIRSGRVSKPLRSSVLSKNHNLFLENLNPRKKGSPSKDGSLSPPPAAVIVHPSTELIEIGKRDVKKFVEKQVVICKKQKTFDDTSDGMVAIEKNKFDTKTPNKPQSPAATSGSSYVYMGNLSLGIKEETVLDFFKNTGKVVSVRLHESDRRLFCFAHVRFDTSETAQKALKRNWDLLCGYPVEMFLVHDEMPDLDVDPHSKLYEYLFMDNLSPSTRINDVLDFFKDTGEIELVRFDKCWGRFSGSGYIQFSTPEEARKGLERNKEKLLGHAVELVLTTHAIASIGLTPNWRKVGTIGRGYGPTTYEER